MRKVGASIQKTIYEDYKVAAKGLGIDHLFRFQQNTIKCLYNGAKIDFSGLDDPEKIRVYLTTSECTSKNCPNLMSRI